MSTPPTVPPVMPPPVVSLYKKTSSLATASLVCGLVGWYFIFVGSLAAVITGHLAQKEIRESQGRLGGNGMALAGLIMGYIQLALCLLLVFLLMFLIFSSSSGGPDWYVDSYTLLLKNIMM